MNGHKPSSQTVFLPRQDSFFATSSIPNGHVFSSRGPALRAALASPPAVGPDGPSDSRDSYPDTAVVHGVALGEGERATASLWQDKAGLAGIRVKRDKVPSIAYSEELIFSMSATL